MISDSHVHAFAEPIYTNLTLVITLCTVLSLFSLRTPRHSPLGHSVSQNRPNRPPFSLSFSFAIFCLSFSVSPLHISTFTLLFSVSLVSSENRYARCTVHSETETSSSRAHTKSAPSFIISFILVTRSDVLPPNTARTPLAVPDRNAFIIYSCFTYPFHLSLPLAPSLRVPPSVRPGPIVSERFVSADWLCSLYIFFFVLFCFTPITVALYRLLGRPRSNARCFRTSPNRRNTSTRSTAWVSMAWRFNRQTANAVINLLRSWRKARDRSPERFSVHKRDTYQWRRQDSFMGGEVYHEYNIKIFLYYNFFFVQIVCMRVKPLTPSRQQARI